MIINNDLIYTSTSSIIMDHTEILNNEKTLDPENWDHHREIAHQMVDDVFNYLSTINDKPVWTEPSTDSKQSLKESLPQSADKIENVYSAFCKNIFPYPKGNIHPMFFSWVDGTGTITGVMADMLASAMNSNLGIGNHIAVYVEQQVIEWSKEMIGFPSNASGVIVSGGSIANITALIIARNKIDNGEIKQKGLRTYDKQLILYCSTETHNCVFKAAQVIGIGLDNIRKISVNHNYEINLELLEKQIELDKANGLFPFCIVANAGTVNTGAIDPIIDLCAIANKHNIWLHVDGAIGAVTKMLPEYADKMRGIELADSIAFDFHKWLYINYEAACVLVRDADAHKKAFKQQADYLAKHERGLAAGPESFSSYGMELSRSFKSLKIWMNIKEHGMERYKKMIRKNIAQAKFISEEIEKNDLLELMAPVSLNIVCFRYHPRELNDDALNELNKEIVMLLHERGIAAPSYTILNGDYALRLSITNHRTLKQHLVTVIEKTISIGNELVKGFQKIIA